MKEKLKKYVRMILAQEAVTEKEHFEAKYGMMI